MSVTTEFRSNVKSNLHFRLSKDEDDAEKDDKVNKKKNTSNKEEEFSSLLYRTEKFRDFCINLPSRNPDSIRNSTCKSIIGLELFF